MVDDVKCLFVINKDKTSNFVIVEIKQNLNHKLYLVPFQ